MKINELKGKQLEALLNELFGLKGAKEVFAKHNIEMKTKETELNGLENLLKGITKLFNENKAAQEYKQAVMFLDTQINTNKSMLATAEGFMKTMIEGMIHSFESTKLTAVMSQSELFRKELYCLLDNIIDEEDIKTVQGYMDTMSLDKIDDFMKQIETVKTNIKNRYSGKDVVVEEKTKEEVVKENKPAKKVEKKKEETKVSEENQKNIDDIEKQLIDLENKEKEVAKQEETKAELDTELGDIDVSDIDDIDLGDSFDEEEPKQEVVEEVKEKEIKKEEVKEEKSVESNDEFDVDLGDIPDDFGDFDMEDNELNFNEEEIDPFM